MGRVIAKNTDPIREADLAAPAAAWMRGRGFRVHAEVPCAGRCIDLVGLHDDGRVCIVELKLSLTKELVSQICSLHSYAHELHVVVRSLPRFEARPWKYLEHNGIGVLRYWNNECRTLRPYGSATREHRGGGAPFPGAVSYLKRMCEAVGEGDDAGHPTRKGIGPAQSVCDEVDALLSVNPALSWKEIFEQVPNHYASAKSMQGAIGRVREARKLDARKRGVA